ncbi:hypothetical protein ATO6_08305 [Oceanicola sp. 22II-s10i]|uniref:hypothetical protein n=1 Tax=Oceanicola sp. 22II-s10i TaxID=1317116 RepID=UPI000B528602|nr:hypothetical protein [Oceanicola sp. 22II-s10i]OWU85048.1 hypothetical protein ATO6_08305 [Oceanicola sp. 22II-s10i]
MKLRSTTLTIALGAVLAAGTAHAAEGLRPTPVALPQGMQVDTPTEVVKDRLAASCAGSFATGEFFESSTQLDGMAGSDIVFDYGEATCDGEPMMEWCGTGGCIRSIWLSDGRGDYREIYEGPGWNVAAGAHESEIVIDAHGAHCGVPGFQGCSVTYRVSASGLDEVSAEPLTP